MSQQTPDERPAGRRATQRRRARHGWAQALAVVLAGLAVMVVVAALGLWAAGAADVPGGAFPRVIAAVVVMAVGGSVDVVGDAGTIAETAADLSVLPLSVTLAGALVIASGFLRPLRHRAVAGSRELAGWAGRIAVLWVPALIGLAFLARHRFTVPLGDEMIGDVTELLDISPEVGFEADVALTIVFGLLWLIGLFVLTLLVSRKAPLPPRLVRFQESVRPAAFTMVILLLAGVVIGVVMGAVVAATRGYPYETLSVLLLCLPNLVWPAFTIGLGASWEGRVEGAFRLPKVLDSALRAPNGSTVNIRTLADNDGSAWWLVMVTAVLLLGAAFLMAAWSPARMRAWQHAVHMAVALVLTVLTVCLVSPVSAEFGLSLLGIGDLDGGLSGHVSLRPELWSALGLSVVWGLVSGFIGGLLATRVHLRGQAAPNAHRAERR